MKFKKCAQMSLFEFHDSFVCGSPAKSVAKEAEDELIRVDMVYANSRKGKKAARLAIAESTRLEKIKIRARKSRARKAKKAAGVAKSMSYFAWMQVSCCCHVHIACSIVFGLS